MTNSRQDAMRQPELDNSLSNKDRFDKLKESRQKYKEAAFEQKEEARRAGQKIELLTKQLQMLMQQVSGSDEAAETKNKRENDSLRTKIEVTTLEMQRQQKLALHATNQMHEKTMEASEWRKKCAAAEKKVASAADTPPNADYSQYVYGALLGASAVAIIGYGALSVGMSAKR